MARPAFRGTHATLGLSVLLFTFMFLPTFLILLAVIVFFVLAYPRIRRSLSAIRGDTIENY
jgi:hypothetical protein